MTTERCTPSMLIAWPSSAAPTSSSAPVSSAIVTPPPPPAPAAATSGSSVSSRSFASVFHICSTPSAALNQRRFHVSAFLVSPACFATAAAVRFWYHR